MSINRSCHLVRELCQSISVCNRSKEFADGLNQQANRDYQAVIDAYNSGDGYSRLADITQKNYQHAVGDIIDLWVTIWQRATSATVALALQVNRDRFQADDVLQMTISALPGKRPDTEFDIYVMFTEEYGDDWLLTPGGEFSREIEPCLRRNQDVLLHPRNLLSVPVGNSSSKHGISVFGVMVSPYTHPADPSNWLQEPVEIHFRIEPSQEGAPGDKHL